MQRPDSFVDGPRAVTPPFVRWLGVAAALAAILVAGRIGIAELAKSRSPAGHLAQAVEDRLSPAGPPLGSSSMVELPPVEPFGLPIPAETPPATTPVRAGEAAAREAPESTTEAAGPVAGRVPRPRVAVVFDDLGYTLGGVAGELLEMRPPLTFAVLANLPNSSAFAESARSRGHEVILHLPMEPLDPLSHNPGPGSLMVDLEESENLRRLRDQLDDFEGYVGISNHMGSRFCTERKHVGPVLREIRRLRPGCFLLDSRTTPYSILALEARQIGLPCVENNLFLDGDGEQPLSPALQLGAIARARGHAIGIGHVRRETVDAVRTVRERWENEGIDLVALSELVPRDTLP